VRVRRRNLEPRRKKLKHLNTEAGWSDALLGICYE